MRALNNAADERLLVEAAQRDPARFADLYTRNFHAVYAYVARRVAGREEAEDVTSEVFQQALANLKRFEWRGAPFAAWLIRIAANAIADRWRERAREAGDPPGDELRDPSMESVERSAALFELVDKLPQDQRRVVVLRFVEQKSIREIAQELKRTEGAIKQLQFRALEKLRGSMEGANG
ncbi:MAG TPA: sigma-70 family RNA polymerase sigma factor [Candidatus Eisenbacteria bacterium]|nr:sigma-70 family RNA polymerase sigma factor [Candidatus Eisenbacteria bacterium]